VVALFRGSKRRASNNVLVSKSFILPTIRLQSAHVETTNALHSELSQRISLAPQFYRRAPIVLDAEEVTNKISMEHLRELYQQLIRLDLQPVGITNLGPSLQKEAQEIGIPIITVPKGQNRDLVEPTTGKQKTVAKSKTKKASLPETPAAQEAPLQKGERKEVLCTVRSGQQVYARGPNAQLIILGNVSSGAEVLSDGDIHIHGILHGRALAGISGDENARIYTKSMQAELVAIGGLYTSGDALPDPVKEAKAQPCMVFVSEDKKLSFALSSQF